MSLLLETIKLENGILFNLEYHNKRFNAARCEQFGLQEHLDLSEHIVIPHDKKAGLFRCRVSYSDKIEKVEFFPHQFREVKKLKLILDNDIDYHLKFADRNYLENLFEQRQGCDDILIIKDGFVTDSFTANTIFHDGSKWWTPDTPLLPGTQRARLLEQGHIFECKISVNDISKYQKVGLINALWDMDNMPVISVEDIS